MTNDATPTPESLERARKWIGSRRWFWPEHNAASLASLIDETVAAERVSIGQLIDDQLDTEYADCRCGNISPETVQAVVRRAIHSRGER